MKHLTFAIAFLFLFACSKSEKVRSDGTTVASTAAPSTESAPAAPSTAASTPTSAHACDMFTADELKRVTGIDFKQGVSTGSGSASQCGWSRVQGSEGGISVTYYDSNVVPTYAAMPGNKPVSGIGDSAVQDEKNGDIIVAKGNRSAAINFNFVGAKPEWAQELAKMAVQKM